MQIYAHFWCNMTSSSPLWGPPMNFPFLSHKVFWLSIHTIYDPLALNHCLGEIAAYDYLKLFILCACTLMMLGARNCTDGHRNDLKSHPVWGVSHLPWLMELHNNILLQVIAIWCIPYILGRPKSRGPENSIVLLQLLITSWDLGQAKYKAVFQENRWLHSKQGLMTTSFHQWRLKLGSSYYTRTPHLLIIGLTCLTCHYFDMVTTLELLRGQI